MKNIFRKVCLLSSAALVTLGLSAPMASAAAPTASSQGIYVGPVAIGKATGKYYEPSITLAQNLKFDGTLKQLITSVDNIGQLPAGCALYLRVADSQEAQPGDSSWVKYQEDAQNSTNSLATSEALKRSNVGTYYVYYYVDGGASYDDIATAD